MSRSSVSIRQIRNCHSIVSKSNSTKHGSEKSMVKPFKSIPGPRSLPIMGSLLNYIPPFGAYRFDRLHWTGKLKYEKYGKIVREEIVPGVNLLFLFDPADIETLFKVEGKNPCRMSHLALQQYRIVDTPEEHPSAGLLPTNGEEWGMLRRTFQKALAVENVRLLTHSIDNVVQMLVEKIKCAETSSTFSAQHDFLPHLMRLALELVGITFFGVKMDEDKDLPYSLDEIVEAAMKVNSLTLEMEKGLRLWRWFDTPKYRIIKNNTKLLESTARRYVKMHLEGDSRLITNACIVKHWLEDTQNENKNIVTMSADMILAGIDTTSLTTGFALYHLAVNERCQETLFNELKDVLPSLDSPITTETLTFCTYLKRVVKESLRMSPISVGIGRVLQNDVVLGGYHVPAKTNCITQGQVICRFPDYFEKPDDFFPERWAPENKRMARVHPYLMVPFGHGPRACIGRRLAENEMYVIIAKLVRNFQLEWKGKKDLDAISTTINKPDGPLLFNFVPRTK